MGAENDNAPELPTPGAFSTLIAELLGAHHRMLDAVRVGGYESAELRDAERECEAKRIRILECYERAYQTPDRIHE